MPWSNSRNPIELDFEFPYTNQLIEIVNWRVEIIKGLS
jgi:hypothetical protein